MEQLTSIQGVQVLSEQIFYKTTALGVIFSCVFIIFAVFLFLYIFENTDHILIGFLCAAVSFILGVVSMSLAGEQSHSTILNQPKSHQYTIEITDAAAWSELAPRYRVVEQVFEGKDIYVVESIKD